MPKKRIKYSRTATIQTAVDPETGEDTLCGLYCPCLHFSSVYNAYECRLFHEKLKWDKKSPHNSERCAVVRRYRKCLKSKVVQ